MSQPSLLARINESRYHGPATASDVVEDIMRNLRMVFNSRSGCCETRIDFGVEDFNTIKERFPDAIPAIGQTLIDQIRNFEPRLERVTVRHIPDPENPLSLNFAITASVLIGDETERISLDTILGHDGHIRVRE